MCGYCVEGGVVLDFVANEKSSNNQELENNWISIYLQETTQFPGIIGKLKTFESFPESIDIAFCRLWEVFLYQEHTDIYDLLTSEYGAKAVNDFLDDLKSNCHNEKWKLLGDNEIYTSRDCWERFSGNANQLIEDSESTLKWYYNFWVLGENKEFSDPRKRMDETGIMDPIENTTPKDWDKFFSLFPVAYFSFLILARHKIDAKIIKQIALECPRDVPSFAGNDLWLQRKAFAVCVKYYGVQFILDNYDDIRLEMIYYSLLKESICVADLDVLKKHLLLHGHWVNGVDSDSVVDLTNNI